MLPAWSLQRLAWRNATDTHVYRDSYCPLYANTRKCHSVYYLSGEPFRQR